MTIIGRLSPEAPHRTSEPVSDLFDMKLRALRRDRAARVGPERFLLERAFEDCLDRLSLVQNRFARALLIGCPDPEWRARLGAFAEEIEIRDPGPLFASAAQGQEIIEDQWEPPAQAFDLVLAVGTLDTVNDLPSALMKLRFAMKPGALFLGAMSGGDTLPQLRLAMRVADQASGAASAHVHPRIEASALAPLLTRCGFVNAVIDVDRAQVSYSSFARLIKDLRHMGSTNILSQRSRSPILKASAAAASTHFEQSGDGLRTIETFEILHFACWVPPHSSRQEH